MLCKKLVTTLNQRFMISMTKSFQCIRCMSRVYYSFSTSQLDIAKTKRIQSFRSGNFKSNHVSLVSRRFHKPAPCDSYVIRQINACKYMKLENYFWMKVYTRGEFDLIAFFEGVEYMVESITKNIEDGTVHQLIEDGIVTPECAKTDIRKMMEITRYCKRKDKLYVLSPQEVVENRITHLWRFIPAGDGRFFVVFQFAILYHRDGKLLMEKMGQLIESSPTDLQKRRVNYLKLSKSIGDVQRVEVKLVRQGVSKGTIWKLVGNWVISDIKKSSEPILNKKRTQMT